MGAEYTSGAATAVDISLNFLTAEDANLLIIITVVDR